MEDFSLKNRIMKEMDANYRKLGELFENMDKEKKSVNGNWWSYSGWSVGLLMEQYRKNVSRIFCELEMQENRLRTTNNTIVRSLEKKVREADDMYERRGHADRVNYFRGRFQSEVDAIISKRSRLRGEFRKIERRL